MVHDNRSRSFAWYTAKYSVVMFCLSALLWVNRAESGMYKFVSLSEARTHWIDLLQHPALRTLPEAQLLLELLKNQRYQVEQSGGVMSSNWFTHVRHHTLLLNGREFASLARMFAIYTDANKKRLQSVTRDSLFGYWAGGWKGWLWERLFALKVLPGLLHATARLRFRETVRQTQGWSYPLETREEVLAGLLTQARFFRRIRQNPEFWAGWKLVPFKRLDTPYNRLWQIWKLGGIQGVYHWYNNLASRPLSVLSPTYSLYPMTDFFRIVLSKKRPAFQLNRKHMDSILWYRRPTLLRELQSEIKLVQSYLDFIQQKVPQKIEQIVTKRLRRLGVSGSEPRAELLKVLWRRRLNDHYENNLLVEAFQNKQKLNQQALKLLKNKESFQSLRQAHQQTLRLWWEHAPPPASEQTMTKKHTQKPAHPSSPPRLHPAEQK